MLTRHIVLGALALLLAACVTGQRIAEVQPSMSRAQVVDILGPPSGVQRQGEYEALHYGNRLMSGWSWDRSDYYVILRSGSVVEYGHGQVRSHDPTMLVLVPLG